MNPPSSSPNPNSNPNSNSNSNSALPPSNTLPNSSSSSSSNAFLDGIDPLEWKFMQSFGDDNSSDDDLVTAVEFDESGDYLAVGDKAGRICIFEGRDVASGGSTRSARGKKGHALEYKFYTEFQSHEPEFDCLKSLEIEEKINMIKFAKRQNNGLYLLATNDKTIKFWKVHEKKIKRPTNRVGTNSAARPPSSSSGSPREVSIPKLSHYQTITTATAKRVYSNAHVYHINSISINSDSQTFLSADDLRVNLWNLETSSESFNIVDIKPSNLEELTEVITSAAFHPSHCNLLLYSTSRGSIRVADLRDAALCDTHSRAFEQEEDPTSKSFFSEIISSISDAKFTPDGKYILSRDYLTLKLWDVAMESRPVQTIPIHDYLRVHLCDLYENDCIFDKFECSASPDSTRFLTGSYNNQFVIHHTDTNYAVTIEALKDPPRKKKKQQQAKKPTATTSVGGQGAKPDEGSADEESPNVNLMDFGKKALHVSWHPSVNAVAVAGLNKLYIYQALNQL